MQVNGNCFVDFLERFRIQQTEKLDNFKAGKR